ncbi:ArsR/SmtB family transcription factor [Streptomyces fuscigenes]|uniref:ArsR/SmtB family transcription factor n=1 Tax=Streptomyces fuscigenes TaxID=1528880 RepID=UPI001F3A9EBC|nr:metalloregulator ArsR/SmtB family transcription factor [Streptomyces fuscigenes]MCF3962528.1 metalloregulator ArsR/SmtB family transcription factor [Streptomyces fuscigenes]
MDPVFRALADPTRRFLLDLLRQEGGRSLGELCAGLDMTRQAVAQHLAVLEAANLVSTVRRGREKLHHLNPVPLYEMRTRWIGRFEEPRLRALATIKQKAEDAMNAQDGTDREGAGDGGRAGDDAGARPAFVYVVYIESTAEQVWRALTDEDLTARYWGHGNVSDWSEGSAWRHERTDGSGISDAVGTVVESRPPARLVTTWAPPDAAEGRAPSRVTFAIEEHEGIVRLTVTHEDLADEAERAGVARGWPAVLSNLKSFLERGTALPTAPWSF